MQCHHKNYATMQKNYIDEIVNVKYSLPVSIGKWSGRKVQPKQPKHSKTCWSNLLQRRKAGGMNFWTRVTLHTTHLDTSQPALLLLS